MKTTEKIILCSQGECEMRNYEKENYEKSLLNETTVLKQVNKFFFLLIFPFLIPVFSIGQSSNLSIGIKSSAKQSCLYQPVPVSFNAVINPLVTTNQLVDSFTMTTYSYYKYSTPVLLQGQKYLLVVNGCYSVWNKQDWFMDAGFLYKSNVITTYSNCVSYPYGNRPTVDVYDSITHLYQYCIIGRGTPLTVYFSDSNYGDNRGSLHYELYAVQTDFIYSWNFGDGTTSSVPAPTHIYSQAGIYPVTLTLRNEVCSNNAYSYTYLVKDTITIIAPPIVNTGQDQILYLGYGDQKFTLTAASNQTVNYLWNTSQTTASITVNPVATTTYSITATNLYGCKASDDVIISVIDVRCCNDKKDDKKDKDKDKDKEMNKKDKDNDKDKDKDNEKCKVILCHSGHSICVDKDAVSAHLAHGDYLGKCDTHISYNRNFEAELNKNKEDDHTQNYQIGSTAFTSDIMLENYPNPVKDVVIIKFRVPESENVKIEIIDLKGYSTVLFDQMAEYDKTYSLNFQMEKFSNGIYLIKLSDIQRSSVSKMIVMKE